MKKSLIILLALFAVLSASAQRRGKKVQQPKYTVTAQEAMAAYDFSLAEEILEHQIAELTKKNFSKRFASHNSSFMPQNK